MSNQEQEQPPWSWADVMACSYCKNYQWEGGHAASPVCKNKESPYYDSSQSGSRGMDLTSEQSLRGCDKINYNNQKIPAFLFKIIPKDSKLLKHPLTQLVEDYTEDMDLKSETTIDELIKAYF